MKVSAIKKLVENVSLTDLKQAEEDLIEEKDLAIEVVGEDEGEQLTHILAAVWILETMDKESLTTKEGLRAYTARVRKSID